MAVRDHWPADLLILYLIRSFCSLQFPHALNHSLTASPTPSFTHSLTLSPTSLLHHPLTHTLTPSRLTPLTAQHDEEPELQQHPSVGEDLGSQEEVEQLQGDRKVSEGDEEVAEGRDGERGMGRKLGDGVAGEMERGRQEGGRDSLLGREERVPQNVAASGDGSARCEGNSCASCVV